MFIGNMHTSHVNSSTRNTRVDTVTYDMDRMSLSSLEPQGINRLTSDLESLCVNEPLITSIHPTLYKIDDRGVAYSYLITHRVDEDGRPIVDLVRRDRSQSN